MPLVPERGGRTGANADGGPVSVRFANGDARTRTRWLFVSSQPTPGPDSEVFVPSKPPGETTSMVALFGGIAQILSSMVVTR